MSWLTEYLLRNSFEIKRTHDFDSDQYNNLLLIEKRISTLLKDGFITDSDIKILKLLSYGTTFEDVSEQLNLSRETVSKRFTSICDKISFSLGDVFTDEGYLSYLQSKYRLSEEELLKIKDYMGSKFKNKLLRR